MSPQSKKIDLVYSTAKGYSSLLPLYLYNLHTGWQVQLERCAWEGKFIYIEHVLSPFFYILLDTLKKKDIPYSLGADSFIEKYRDDLMLGFYQKHVVAFDSTSEKKALCLDLFVYYEGKIPGQDEPVFKYVVWDRNPFHLKKYLEKPESMEFYGGSVPIPAQAEQFIEVKYGANWRTPIKEWNVALDDGAIYRADES